MTIENTTLSVGQISPNEYNPNHMTDREFAELVVEVKHLGRLPKPVIVRPNGSGYIVVDGEHGWRAAIEAGIKEVPVEIVTVDDFEARRQTFKRNQHGTHNQVLLGVMFQQMMKSRDLSGRALAKEIEVSEGTVRNAITYADAADLRNCYAPTPEEAQATIASLSTRQVRCYDCLPAPLRDFWLDAGADPKDIDRVVFGIEVREDGSEGRKIGLELSYQDWLDIVEGGFACGVTASRFLSSMETAVRLWWWVRNFGDFLERASEFAVAVAELRTPFTEAILDLIPIRLVDQKAEPIVSPQRWAAIVRDAVERASDTREFLQIIHSARRLEIQAAGFDELDVTDPRFIERRDALVGAPAIIRESGLSVERKVHLWQRSNALSGTARDAVLAEVVPAIEHRDAMVTGTHPLFEQIGNDEQRVAIKVQWLTTGDDDAYFDRAVESRLFSTREELVDSIVSAQRERCVVEVGGGLAGDTRKISGVEWYEVLRSRLLALPMAELRLLGAYVIEGYQPKAHALWFSSAEEAERGSSNV